MSCIIALCSHRSACPPPRPLRVRGHGYRGEREAHQGTHCRDTHPLYCAIRLNLGATPTRAHTMESSDLSRRDRLSPREFHEGIGRCIEPHALSSWRFASQRRSRGSTRGVSFATHTPGRYLRVDASNRRPPIHRSHMQRTPAFGRLASCFNL